MKNKQDKYSVCDVCGAMREKPVVKENLTTESEIIIDTLKGGNKIMVCGNGGSATMSQHLVGELMGKFEHERQPLPAISLFDLATITAIANDYGYEHIFSRQIKALGNKGDVLITLSTSGKSKNVLEAISQAHKQGLIVVEAPINQGLGTADIQLLQLDWIHNLCREIELEFI